MIEMREFKAKILLFGEYSILLGQPGLVMPLGIYSGKFEFPSEGRPVDKGISRSRKELELFLDYLESVSERLPGNAGFQSGNFRSDIEQGIFFNSDIPVKYGVGSSAALVAAVFERYIKGSDIHTGQHLGALRRVFALMESHFHGQSSGTDPLCAYLDTTLLVEGDDASIVELKGHGENGSFFLVDSGRPGGTGSLVKGFLLRMENGPFRNFMEERYNPLVRTCILTAIENRKAELGNCLQLLSRMQWEEFRPMIPDDIRDPWHHGLHTGLFSMKLCGSGGGGFLLGYSEELPLAEEWFRGHGLRTVPVDL